MNWFEHSAALRHFRERETQIDLPAELRSHADRLDDAFGVTTDTDQRGRGHGIEKVKADEVETWNLFDNSHLVDRIAVPLEDGKVNPRKAVVIAGAPDDVRGDDGVIVLEERQSVSDADDSWYALDSSVDEVLELNSYQRRGAGKQFGTCLSAD